MIQNVMSVHPKLHRCNQDIHTLCWELQYLSFHKSHGLILFSRKNPHQIVQISHLAEIGVGSCLMPIHISRNPDISVAPLIITFATERCKYELWWLALPWLADLYGGGKKIMSSMWNTDKNMINFHRNRYLPLKSIHTLWNQR